MGHRLLQWSGRATATVVRIHGPADRLLPFGTALSQYQLPDGHLIIISRAVEIGRILNGLAIGNAVEKITLTPY